MYVCLGGEYFVGMIKKNKKNWNLKKWEGDSYARLGNGGGRHN